MTGSKRGSTTPLRIWIWVAICLCVLNSVLVAGLHLRQQNTVAGYVKIISDLRRSRVDLARAALHFTLGGEPDSPYQREQGLALLGQASRELQRVVFVTSPTGGSSPSDFHPLHKAVQEFVRATARVQNWNAASDRDRNLFRETLSSLEREADSVDVELQRQGAHLAEAHQRDFTVGVFLSAILLSGVCLVLLAVGRAQARVTVALQNSEELLRETGHIAQVGGWHYDVETRESIWTQEVARIFDLEPMERTSLDFGLEYFEPESRERLLNAVRRGEKEGVPYDLELEIVTAAGRRKWVRSLGTPILEGGRVVSVRGSLQDITENKVTRDELQENRARLQRINDELEQRVEQGTARVLATNELLQAQLREKEAAEIALRSTEGMLHLVMDTIPQAIYWRDRSGRVLGCNHRLAQDLGFAEPDHIVGGAQVPVGPPEHPFNDLDADLQIMDQNRGHLGILSQQTRPDGSTVWWRSHKLPLHDNAGGVMGILACCDDITQEKEAEATMRRAGEISDAANRSKNEFLSRMSHELRTPLNAILGFGQILEMSPLAEKDRASVDYILKAGHHLLELVNEVLDISRIESGNLAFNLETLALEPAILQSLQLMEAQAKSGGVELRHHGLEGAELLVRADRHRFRQVMINLLSNAIKYNHPGGHVEVGVVKLPGAYRMEVTDTGPGLKEEEIERLFMPFERLWASRSGFEGTGIGLFLCKQIVEALGGTIGARCVPEVGCTFWVELPAVEGVAPPVRTEPVGQPFVAAAPESVADQDRRTILYIEDNLSNLNLIESIYEDRPEIEILPAMQGSIGVDLARQYLPDLILLDLHLPDLEGDAVLRLLQNDENTRHIPIVMLSADALPDQIARLRAAGARDYLTKPLDLKKFLSVVDEVLVR